MKIEQSAIEIEKLLTMLKSSIDFSHKHSNNISELNSIICSSKVLKIWCQTVSFLMQHRIILKLKNLKFYHR